MTDRLLAALVLAALHAALAPAAATAQAPGVRGTLIITNKSAATASLVDLATARVVAELPTGAGPHEVAASADGRTAVVTDYGAQTGGSTLTVIDVAGRRVARTVDLGRHTRPHGIAWMPGDSLVAVTSEASRHVVLVRVADGAIVREIGTGHPASHMLAVTADGRRIYTGNISAATVSELDANTGAHLRSLATPPQPEAIGVTPDGAEVWVGSNSQGLVSVVRTSDGQVTTAASGFGWPYRILFTPDRRRVLLPDFRGNELRVLDASSHAELARLPFGSGGPQGITLTPDGRTAFLSLSQEGRVAIIDLGQLRVAGYVPAGPTPDGVAYSRLELR